MQRTFWLLDLNHENYEGRSSIWLWGITHEGKRVLIIDDNYRAYFYLLPRKDQDPEELRKKLEAEKPHPTIENTTIEKKKLLADERVVLKVFCKDPDFLEKAARETLKKTGAEATYEEKLRLAIKYHYDYGIKPCQWYEADTTASTIDPKKCSVQETLTAKAHAHAIAREDPPSVDLFSFSLLSVSKIGAPSAIRDPVQVVSWRTNKDANEVVLTQTHSDESTIQRFGEDVTKINPDFVLSFEGNSVHWPYLVKRAKQTKTPLRVGRDGGPPHQSLYGHYSLIGRANVDLLNFAEDLYEVKNKTIENVAKYLGIQSSTQKPIDETAYFDYWSKPDRRETLIKQLEEKTETILKIGQEAIDYVIQISALSGLPPDQVIAAAVGFRVDNYLMMETHKLGQLIPSRMEQPIIPYKGAIVLEPKVGLHDNVASLDFSSMYPSLMIKYNISPDTLVTGKEKEDVFEVPEVKHRFRKNPSGFYRVVLTKLIEARKATKAELQRTAPSDSRYPLLKAREKAVKVMTNPVRATTYVQDLTSNLKSKNLPLSSFIIWKTLTKPMEAYEVNAPHVEAAKKMERDGWPVTAGDKVGFIITKKSGKLFQKAEPHYKVTIDEVDYDYYVRNQIVPAAARILEILSVSESQLLAVPASQASLSAGTKRG